MWVLRARVAFVAGGIVGVLEIKFWRRSRQKRAAIQSHTPYSPRGFAARLSAQPPKLYFACAYNTASYAGYAQNGGHPPNNRLTETCSLGLTCTSLILDIYIMINWHLSKQGICWPVSRDHIAGSSLQLIEVTCFFFGVDCWPSAGFR